MFGLAEIQAMNADAALAVEATTIGTLTEAQKTIETLQEVLWGHDEDCVSGDTLAEWQDACSALLAGYLALVDRLEEAYDPHGQDQALRYEMADLRAWGDIQRPI